MNNSHSASYAAAGVNIEAGYEGVRLMKRHVERTIIPGVVSDLGGFGGLFEPDTTGMNRPVLVSGTDGVGTKQRIAQLMDKHDTVGIDCVAMCVNDIICCGAKPLFFLDYIAIGKNEPEKVASIVSGVAEGCVQAGCALIGGETAEHPGVMDADDYDLAGFSVGMVDREKVISSSSMREGDVILALPSSGIHSNGYSLVRKVFDVEHGDLSRYCDDLGQTLGEALLTPTIIYVKPVLAAIAAAHVHGISHITGGGLRKLAPLRARRPLRQNRKGRRKNSRHLPHAPESRQHSRTRHVQHLQHGRGHDRHRVPRHGRQGSGCSEGRRLQRLRSRRNHCRRGKGRPRLMAAASAECGRGSFLCTYAAMPCRRRISNGTTHLCREKARPEA